MALKLEPLADMVVVRPIPESDVTATGILIVTSSQEAPTRGEVLAVGPGRTTDAGSLITPCVSAGDVVIFTKYAGTAVRVGDEDLKILREKDCLCAVRED